MPGIYHSFYLLSTGIIICATVLGLLVFVCLMWVLELESRSLYLQDKLCWLSPLLSPEYLLLADRSRIISDSLVVLCQTLTDSALWSELQNTFVRPLSVPVTCTFHLHLFFNILEGYRKCKLDFKCFAGRSQYTNISIFMHLSSCSSQWSLFDIHVFHWLAGIY